MVATTSQLQAVIAVREAKNFTLAARRLGLAQPTVHRAVTQIEEEAARPCLSGLPMVSSPPAPPARWLRQRLAFAELAQAEGDLAETLSEEAGSIVVGATPLSRSFVFPRAIAEFRKLRPNTPIHIVEGTYTDLLAGLRRGEIDFLIGALRDPAPIGDRRPAFPVHR
ncbi:DNA-binding transcriptional LysR family regulator [Rhizobium binae]|uniref:DNA-binding transcriptional LysR family regulator n=1 Tax=Rhizobium binae TaxID=1138190 RepID=A0ABV2MAK1_9HYPH